MSANYVFINLFETVSQLALFLLHYPLKQQVETRRTSRLLFSVFRSKLNFWNWVHVIRMHCNFNYTAELFTISYDLLTVELIGVFKKNLGLCIACELKTQYSQMKNKCISSGNWILILHCFVWTLSVLNLSLYAIAVYNKLIRRMWCDKIIIKVFNNEFHSGFSQSG